MRNNSKFEKKVQCIIVSVMEVAGELGYRESAYHLPVLHSNNLKCGKRKIRGITIRSGHIIDGISFTYVTPPPAPQSELLREMIKYRGIYECLTMKKKIGQFSISSKKLCLVRLLNKQQVNYFVNLELVDGSGIRASLYLTEKKLEKQGELLFQAFSQETKKLPEWEDESDWSIRFGLTSYTGWLNIPSLGSQLSFENFKLRGYMSDLFLTKEEEEDAYIANGITTAGGAQYAFNLNIEENEHLVLIHGKSSIYCGYNVVKLLTFMTSHGRNIGHFGIDNNPLHNHTIIHANGSPLLYFQGKMETDSHMTYSYLGFLRIFFVPYWRKRKMYILLRELYSQARADFKFLERVEPPISSINKDDVLLQRKNKVRKLEKLSSVGSINSSADKSFSCLLQRLFELPDILFQNIIQFYF